MNDRLIGRAGFLGLMGLGVAGLFVGRDVPSTLGKLLPSSVGAIVPTSGWRIYTIGNGLPKIDPAAYRLRVDGLVESPATLTLADLRNLDRVEQVSDFHCVTGWSVKDVHWAGFRVQTLLDQVKPLSSATALRFVSDEVPYDDALTFEQALLPDVLLAYEMDGRALPRPHGAPLRLVIPDMYGYKNVKWVTRIEVVEKPAPGYWEQRGYDTDAWVGGSNGLGA